MKALVLNDDGKFGTAEFPAGNGTPSGLLPPIRWFQWVFDIGARGTGKPPMLGFGGKNYGQVLVQPGNGYKLVTIWLEIWGGRDATYGEGTGSYEITFPAAFATLTPPREQQFVGIGDLYIAGGGTSSFPVSLKWTDHGKPMNDYKIVVDIDGYEWSKTWPKPIAEFKLHGYMQYWIVG